MWRAFAKPLRYAALAAGALPTLAFPQLNLEFLGWCGLVPAILIIRTAPSAREAAVRGWWLGAARTMRMAGTSPHQPRNSRLSCGNASVGSAPAASAAYRGGLAKARHTAMPSIVGPPGCAGSARPHP